jgi:hypothetical protein
LDVIVAAMDPKEKAPALIYGVVNMEGRYKKRKARTIEATIAGLLLVEAKTRATTGADPPPMPVEHFDVACMDLVTVSKMDPGPSGSKGFGV